jgi:hypothetical protein
LGRGERTNQSKREPQNAPKPTPQLTKHLLSVLLVVPIFFEDKLLKAPKKRLSGMTMFDKP